MNAPHPVALFLAALAPLALGCSDGSTVTTAPPTSSNFNVDLSNVAHGDTWQLNRPIALTFSDDVDFASVTADTVRIYDTSGAPVLGTYALRTPRVLEFAPTCPTAADTFPGFAPAAAYRLELPSGATASTGLTVRSTAGVALSAQFAVEFETPDSTDPAELYFDPVDGPPRVLVRGRDGVPTDADHSTHVEFPGRDVDGDGVPDRAYVEFDAGAGLGSLATTLPLNRYAHAEERFAVRVAVDQPVDPAVTDPGAGLVRLECFDAALQTWAPLPAVVRLDGPCTADGATLRVEPEGILPANHDLRLVVDAGLRDVSGDTTVLPDTVASFTLDPLPGGALVDGVLESFEDRTRYDASSAANSGADWNADEAPGTLTAASTFPGTGGPGGEFDWVVRPGHLVVLNTDSDTIIAGPDGQPAYAQHVIGGLVQVRDLHVQAGGWISIVGSNPCTILATGDVLLEGSITLNGRPSLGVPSLNTTNQSHAGAAGSAGGGRGGTGSPETTMSSASGTAGFGAFDAPLGGGRGGESGFAAGGICAKENRRGAGGGGGRFGSDVRYLWNGALVRCQTLVGMDVERGIIGSLGGQGALSEPAPAQGGAAGPSPFVDSDPTNDFYGILEGPDGARITGELPSLWAGAGGGGGGDASRTASWPLTPFDPQGDERGAGGGGAAGGLEIQALGDIEIRPGGRITADGGHGGAGERYTYFDRIGGGSGGGSGGHIVLSSASRVILGAEAQGTTVGAFYMDSLATHNHTRRPLSAVGGQGGAGRESQCGANEDGQLTWAKDSIPIENFEGDHSIPPQSATNPNGILNWARACTLHNHAACQTEGTPGETFGAGGDGGPGLIQIHVDDPATQLVLGAQGAAFGSYGAGGDPTFSMCPPPVGWTRPDAPAPIGVPFHGRRSTATTRWIPLGYAARPDGGAAAPVDFFFDGTDPATGEVLRDGDVAASPTPLVPFTALGAGTGAPTFDSATATFSFPAAILDDPNELYRAAPNLLREAALRVRDASSPAEETEFAIRGALFDEALGALVVTVESRDDTLVQTLAGLGTPEVELVPYFVRLMAAGSLDAYPDGSSIALVFDAAKRDPITGSASTAAADQFSGGDPNGFTARIDDLDADVWDFVRMRFEFTRGAADPAATAPGIDLVRFAFRF